MRVSATRAPRAPARPRARARDREGLCLLVFAPWLRAAAKRKSARARLIVRQRRDRAAHSSIMRVALRARCFIASANERRIRRARANGVDDDVALANIAHLALASRRLPLRSSSACTLEHDRRSSRDDRHLSSLPFVVSPWRRFAAAQQRASAHNCARSLRFASIAQRIASSARFSRAV